MKKTFIIALCCLVAVMAACKKKPVEPTPDPEPTNYAELYVGNYVGSFALTVLTMNEQAVTNFTFPIDSIGMNITEGDEENAITATVTVENETHQTTGTATKDKANFDPVHLVIDETHQLSKPYLLHLDLQMEGNKAESDTLYITGSFTGNGVITFNNVENILDEVSGTLSGKLVKQ